MKIKKRSLSVDEAAEQLGVGTRTIINYLHSKRLIGNKVGKRWFIKIDSFEKLQENQNDSNKSFELNRDVQKNKELLNIKLSAFERILECSKIVVKYAEKDLNINSKILERLALNLEYSLEMIINGYFSFGHNKVLFYEKSKEGLARGLAILYPLLSQSHPLLQAYLEAINATVALAKRIQNDKREKKKKNDI